MACMQKHWPTKDNLFCRKITPDKICEVCGNFKETKDHVLWHCYPAKEVWKEVGLDTEKVMDKCPKFLDLVWYARNMKQWLEEDIRLMVMTAWGIWTNRNEVCHGKSRKPASVLARWINNYLEDYLMANHSTQPYKESTDATWQFPKPLWYKANMDGAVFAQHREAGVGVMIRDHYGAVVATLSKKLKAPLGALKVEAKAMEEAVSFTRNMGIRDCIFESESLTVVNAMLRLIDPPSAIANNVAGSLSLLPMFRAVSFSHVPRSRNKVAHTLAQVARGLSGLHTWVEETPGCIENLVSQDVFFLS
ncbi:uncharacterized protein LOC112003714 [Quercus suber]|uniref:uncharacterized protein LOC112003714 n=1 Tax=Quercus suber TaxID=58331 RepID=UPI000CE27075|nr:uncharacterized protein LOC112003714 [Quercus suber]